MVAVTSMGRPWVAHGSLAPGPLGRSGLRVSAISYGAWLTVSETGAAPWVQTGFSASVSGGDGAGGLNICTSSTQICQIYNEQIDLI